MRYACIYHPAPSNQGPPTPEHMAAMGALVERFMKSGELIVTEPLAGPEAGCRVERSDGQFSVSDLAGRAGGYAILQADSREGVIALAKEFLAVAGDGACEIRQIIDMGPPQG
jgi:hypothetical protein